MMHRTIALLGALNFVAAAASGNTGRTATSSPAATQVANASAEDDCTVYSGAGGSEADNDQNLQWASFEMIVVDGRFATFIGQDPFSFKPFLATDIAIESNDSFSGSGINGWFSPTGVEGSLGLPLGDNVFLGTITPTALGSVPSGLYTGSILGQPATSMFGIVGTDRSIALYVSTPNFADEGIGVLNDDGTFSISTIGDNTISGSIDLATGSLNANLYGGPGGTILGAPEAFLTLASGNPVSLSVTGSSEATSFQWQVNTGSGWSNLSDGLDPNLGGAAAAGSATAKLTITGALPSNSGDQFQCVVSSGPGTTATSSATMISVLAPVSSFLSQILRAVERH
jgi:hypothetical protein